jgi:hypothetical protein
MIGGPAGAVVAGVAVAVSWRPLRLRCAFAIMAGHARQSRCFESANESRIAPAIWTTQSRDSITKLYRILYRYSRK